jgi:hypothetical protein
MKTRLSFLAFLFGLLAAVTFAADQAAPALSEDLASQVRAAAQSGDTRALAQLVANNPGLAVQMASVAAAANPAAAASLAATIAAIAPQQAAQVAAAAATVAPSQAALVAATVATIAPTQAGQIAGAVAAAVPQQAGAVTAAVSAAAPTASGDVVNQVAAATNSSTDTVSAQAAAQSQLGQQAAQTGAGIAANVVAIVSMVNMNPIIPQVGNDNQDQTPQNAVDPTLNTSNPV